MTEPLANTPTPTWPAEGSTPKQKHIFERVWFQFWMSKTFSIKILIEIAGTNISLTSSKSTFGNFFLVLSVTKLILFDWQSSIVEWKIKFHHFWKHYDTHPPINSIGSLGNFLEYDIKNSTELDVDQAAGLTYFQERGSANLIHLLLSLHKLFGLYICMSVLPWHPKAYKLHGTSFLYT